MCIKIPRWEGGVVDTIVNYRIDHVFILRRRNAADSVAIELLEFTTVTGLAVTIALLGGETDIGLPAVINVQPRLRTGKLRALAVTTRRKSSALRAKGCVTEALWINDGSFID